MKKSFFLLLIAFTPLYIITFIIQERAFEKIFKPLHPVPPASFLQITSSYGRQLMAEVLFVQSAVFLGGVPPGTDPNSYGETLAHNFLQISTLYPEFSDPYYFAQSYLAYISPDLARKVNTILANGRQAKPNNLIYPFFQAFNYFDYLSEPLEAAKIFREASLLPDAPPMFNHLAVILEAEGGEIQASLLSLQALINSTNDKSVRERYEEEKIMLQQALAVQNALSAFASQRLRYPETLEELVPEYIAELPDFGTAFELSYNPPRISLIRPHRKKASVRD